MNASVNIQPLARLLCVGTLAFLALPGMRSVSPGEAAGLAAPSLRITSVTAHPTTVSRHGSILFTVQVRGLILDRLHMGGKPVAGRGHLQYYLDRIPASAYRSFRDRSSFLGAIGTSAFLFRLTQSAVRITPGRHTILIALARNDYLLYHAAVARIHIKVTG
jgi:hypothetical protein